MKEIKFPENAKLYSLLKKFEEGVVIKITEIPEGVKVKFIDVKIAQREFRENLKALFEKLKIIPEKFLDGLKILARIIARVEQEKGKSEYYYNNGGEK